jgi:hypothetical protein
MTTDEYDNPEIEDKWCCAKRKAVEDYLLKENFQHGRIGEWPAWHIAPYVSIWAIESLKYPENIGWWVITGDLPTDYISSADITNPQHPRKAIKAIAERWKKMVSSWNRGEEFEGISIAGNRNNEELAPLLEKRADLLIEFSEDDSLWEE